MQSKKEQNSRWTTGRDGFCDGVCGVGGDTGSCVARWAYAGRIERGRRIGPTLRIAGRRHRTNELIVIISIYICETFRGRSEGRSQVESRHDVCTTEKYSIYRN